MKCLVEKIPVQPFHVFPKKALFNKPLAKPVPEAVADMTVAYCPVSRHVSSYLRADVSLEDLKAKIYQELYAGFAPTGLSPLQKSYNEYVAKWIASVIPAKSKVLEIGCHDGYILHMLAQEGHSCVGVEPSPFADVAREKYGLDVRNEFFHSSKYPAEAFDVLIMRHVVEHVDDPVGFVADAAKALKPGGILYIEVPNSHWSVEETFFPEFHIDHISYFTLPSLRRLLALSGFGEVLHAEAATAYMRFPFLNCLARKAEAKNVFTPPNYFFDFRIQAQTAAFPQTYARYVDNLKKLTDGRKIAIWGTGSIGTQYAIDADWKIPDVTYVDPNPANQGKYLSVTGHPVHAPEVIQDIAPDVVLIASGWETDVRRQVQPFVGPDTQIMVFRDLLG
jgi:SAM-dependent methyltransferase